MVIIANKNKLRIISRGKYQKSATLVIIGLVVVALIPYFDPPLQYPGDAHSLNINSDEVALKKLEDDSRKIGIKDQAPLTVSLNINSDEVALKKLEDDSRKIGIKDQAPLTVSLHKKSSKGDRGSHDCLNEDFQPKHKASVWTMLNDDPFYVLGALKMGRGVKKYTSTPHDLVVMELQSKPLTTEQWLDLHKVGFMRCVVKSIPAPAKTRPDLKEKFAVLHVWAMVAYETVLFLDADTLVIKSLNSLLNMDLQNKVIGVTKDIRDRKWVSTFNSGVLLLHPSLDEYERLRKLLSSGIKYDYIMSDQGFLNEVYKDNWHEIGFVNNANLALYRFQRVFWDTYPLEEINVIHYTMKKPWKCNASDGTYGPICKIWVDAD